MTADSSGVDSNVGRHVDQIVHQSARDVSERPPVHDNTQL